MNKRLKERLERAGIRIDNDGEGESEGTTD